MWALQRAGDVGSMGCYTMLPTESASYSEPAPEGACGVHRYLPVSKASPSCYQYLTPSASDVDVMACCCRGAG